MTGLMIAETQRFVSRRITRYFPLALALLIVIGVVIAYFVIQAQDETVDFVSDIGAFGRGGGDGFGEAVDQPDIATGVLGPLGFLLPIMAFALGASYYGADQKSGVIELLLTWQPKRMKLLTARAIGGGLVTALIAIALSAFFVAVLYVLASMIGTTDGMTAEMWGWIARSVVRSGVVAGLFFLFGLGLTVVLNNSMASIIVFMIYAFVVENLLQAFVGQIAPFLPMTNAAAFVAGTNVLLVDVFSDALPEIHHGYLLAGVVVLIYSLVALAMGFAVFQRRDVV